MTPSLSRFIELLVNLDVSDAHARHLSPAAYQAAARMARRIVQKNFRHVPFGDFVGYVEPLQTTAENLYFDAHGRLPDLDGSGGSMRAAAATQRLLHRVACRRR